MASSQLAAPPAGGRTKNVNISDERIIDEFPRDCPTSLKSCKMNKKCRVLLVLSSLTKTPNSAPAFCPAYKVAKSPADFRRPFRAFQQQFFARGRALFFCPNMPRSFCGFFRVGSFESGCYSSHGFGSERGRRREEG